MDLTMNIITDAIVERLREGGVWATSRYQKGGDAVVLLKGRSVNIPKSAVATATACSIGKLVDILLKEAGL